MSKLQSLIDDIFTSAHKPTKGGEHFIFVPHDIDNLQNVMKVKEKLNAEKVKYIVVIGIGGSDLGTRAIYEALFGHFDKLQPNRFPKMIFVEAVDENYLEMLKAFLDAEISNTEEVLINAVSKSGTTLETVTNLHSLLDDFPNMQERLVITTAKGSPLWKEGKEKNIALAEIPTDLSGRFSVFSAVGLLPLACAGIDVTALLEGAMAATNDLEEAAQSAVCIFENYNKGKKLLDSFFFDPELETLGEWYEQLVSESLGKQGKGITPMTSIGSNDLHSEAQLDLGGPQDKQFIFVSTDLIQNTEKALYEATKQTYKAHKIPFTEMVFDEIHPIELGYYMQFKMLEVYFLAKLMGVNAFDQPNVEEYKKVAKQILSN